MNKNLRRIPLMLASAGLLAAATVHGAEQQAHLADPNMLEAVQLLYGLSESDAIERLAREEAAAEIYAVLKAEPPTGYAGAWFDGSALAVGLSTDVDANYVRRLGATPVPVTFSLTQLEESMARFVERAHRTLGPRALEQWHIDYPTNRAIVRTAAGTAGEARRVLDATGLDRAAFDIRDSESTLEFSAYVYGANRTRNLTWEAEFPTLANICSVGVSVAGGFATNGHCGILNNVFANAAGTVMGSVQDSAYYFADTNNDGRLEGHFNGQDSAWIRTGSGWTPSPYINGYSDGTIHVPAKWSGLTEYPTNTTVCRYGATTGGPHCGKVAALDVDLYGGEIQDATKVSAVCSQDGDSGGPFIATNGQVQGTVIGDNSNCETATTKYMYFQPVVPALNRYSLSMLTTHGARAPTVSNYRCPDLANSGGGAYSCAIEYYNSQGATVLKWTKADGSVSSSPTIVGNCTSGQMLTVKLRVSNPYGTYPKDVSFTCPTGPMP